MWPVLTVAALSILSAATSEHELYIIFVIETVTILCSSHADSRACIVNVHLIGWNIKYTLDYIIIYTGGEPELIILRQ